MTFVDEGPTLSARKHISEAWNGVLRLDGDTRKFVVSDLDINRLPQYKPPCAINEIGKYIEDSLNKLVNGATSSTSSAVSSISPSPIMVDKRAAMAADTRTSQQIKIDRTRRWSQQDLASVTSATPSLDTTSSSSRLAAPSPDNNLMSAESIGPLVNNKDAGRPSPQDGVTIGQIPPSDEAMDLDINLGCISSIEYDQETDSNAGSSVRADSTSLPTMVRVYCLFIDQ